MTDELSEKLFEEILRARTRVYQIGQPTPLQKLPLLHEDYDVFIKREDLSPINAYKWRGAYNCTSLLKEQDQCDSVVAASAGNHAQGVALACKKLGIKAKIFMPLPTPKMKQTSVKKHGGDCVDIVLIGDTYNEAGDAAKAYAKEHNLTYVHPFDDVYTIAGQATIADEIILSGQGPFDYAFIQIGGGGMAAGVSSWLKLHNPDIKIIGVEGIDQASMKASLKAGKPVTLDKIDTFCDGTAVTRPGDLSFQICQKYIDDIITVTNEEVSAGIQKLWETIRVIPEPAGAMGIAALSKYAQNHKEALKGKKILTIICGANMDFEKLALISGQSAIGAHRRRYLRFHINEERGSLLGLLDSIFSDVSVSEFQYGKVHETKGYPVVAFEALPEEMEKFEQELQKAGILYEDVTGDPDIRYRIINYNPSLFSHPLLMHIHFPERQGALRDLLRKISDISNICYFNYVYSGEAIGRALMGFEFKEKEDQTEFLKIIKDSVVTARMVEDTVRDRAFAISDE